MFEVKYFPPKKEIKIVSYNIHSGLNKDMFPTLFDIIDFLRVSKSDIICLQEVNESAKAGFQVSSFKDELKMHSHFGANVVGLGSNYGLVTYSKYPLKSQNHIYLKSDREQRGMLHTVVNVEGRKLNVINVHLGLGEEERKVQLDELVGFISTLENEPYIVVGDFNQGNMSIDDKILKDVAIELNKANVLTFATGLDRIDYIFVSPNIEVLDYDVLIKNMSDHYPIIAKIRI
ncbi:endonuclease/exonuclease/phosphatase family protein [Romboutsia lituseburensis]|uniref:Metal-dependent hydrolase, endonuclease/exonuclease/phosphatase family n=1 Tax=Romboutsia lituseburensis DSM 797 TaxID=1121325 RepID=A0A1G9NS73_9FIRM|nr:endonuclease/exonuclease/phosphatase family protein [Romboutsia lituseburensis]CEH33099.1 Endonuclease/exonuclease/phosphatase protein [Romboutsia lituseburensis]SDL89432.1 Metal-dependent hydrolase, endonuclease/exonuclease/phosphatase family [Romboutsia lituseburensis DSM 797]